LPPELTGARRRRDTRGPYACPRRRRSSEVLREAAEHIPAVLVDFFGGRRWPVLREHAATGLERVLLRAGRRLLFRQLRKPGFEGEPGGRRSRFERRRLVIRDFDHDHSRVSFASLSSVKDIRPLVTHYKPGQPGSAPTAPARRIDPRAAPVFGALFLNTIKYIPMV